MENEKQINLTNFEKCRNIKLEDVGQFLSENGYNWTGFINEDLFENRIEEYRINCEFFSINISTITFQHTITY